MALTSLPIQELIHNIDAAFGATESGPVFIADGDLPTYVLLSYVDYQRLLTQDCNIASKLAMPTASDIEFEAPRFNVSIRPADFT